MDNSGPIPLNASLDVITLILTLKREISLPVVVLSSSCYGVYSAVLVLAFAICCRPSVCLLSVVCNVRAPYSGG